MPSKFILLFLAMTALIAIGSAAMALLTNAPVSIGVRLRGNPDKLGWMDDFPFSDTDQRRVAEIGGHGVANDQSWISSMQSWARSGVTRRDYELMRQDRRRARAAYPEVKEDNLFYGAWVQVDEGARIPAKWGGPNSNSSQAPGQEAYLDGGDYQSFVKPEYTKRADAETTKRVLAEIKQLATDKTLARIRKWGYTSSMSGTGGSLSIKCYPLPLPSDAHDDGIAGKCLVISNEKDQFIFDYDPLEWVSPPFDLDEIKKLPSFKSAIASDHKREPTKPWVIKDGLLAKGETCPRGRLCFSHWNGDGYDNEDIGPDTPVAWTLDTPFGLNYMPYDSKDERRSTPGAEWTLVVSIYGYPDQISPGWTEKEAKDLMPKFLTEFSWGMQGQDPESMNRGNLRQAWCFQNGSMQARGQQLSRRSLPIMPAKDPGPAPCVQGGSLAPGASCQF